MNRRIEGKSCNPVAFIANIETAAKCSKRSTTIERVRTNFFHHHTGYKGVQGTLTYTSLLILVNWFTACTQNAVLNFIVSLWPFTHQWRELQGVSDTSSHYNGKALFPNMVLQ